MSNTETILLDDVRRSLIKRIDRGVSDSVIDAAFASCLIPDEISSIDIDKVISDVLAGARTPRETAALGFVAHRSLDKVADILSSDIRQLVGREPVVAGTPMPFCMDALTLAGILMGTRAIADESLTRSTQTWLDSCGAVTADGRGLGLWQEPLLQIVGEYANVRWRALGDKSGQFALVRIALRSTGIANSMDIEAETTDELAALNVLRAGINDEIESAEAVIRFTCLMWLRRSRPVSDLQRVSIPNVCTLLSSTPRALQYWTWEDKGRTKTSEPRKWHIDNEYHVQNLLWTMLGPLFPDLVPEDYTVKIGTKQPRADLGVPSLRLIVEAKFWYSKYAAKKMIEEIAEDASLYLVEGSRYDTIVPFIWDEGRRTEDRDSLISALKQIDGIADAIVIAKPGLMM